MHLPRMNVIICVAILAMVVPGSHIVRASAEVLDAQTFLDRYAGATIPAGATIKIQDGTRGAFSGDFRADLKGKIEIGANVALDVTGHFRLNGRLYPGSQITVGDTTTITAGAVNWSVNGNFQMNMNGVITTTQGDVRIKAGSQIQFGQNTTLQAPTGTIELDASDDGDVQIQIVETALALPNIRAGADISVKAGGDIQILDRNVLHAGGNLTLLGTSSEGDIEIGPANPALIAHSYKAGHDMLMETNGDVQIMDSNTLYAGGNLKLKAKSEGDVQVLRADPALTTARLAAGQDVLFEAEGDINFQRGDMVGALPFPDINAGNDIHLTAHGEVEIEPGNWLKADHTIHLETLGVEVQVQPRAYVTLDAGVDIILLGLEENAGITVGEYATLRAQRDIVLQSGHNDQGEGDTRVKEHGALSAGGRMIIESGLHGATEVKERTTLHAGSSIMIESGAKGATVVKGSAVVTPTATLGRIAAFEDGTSLTSEIVTIKTGRGGECVIHPDVLIHAMAQALCPKETDTLTDTLRFLPLLVVPGAPPE